MVYKPVGCEFDSTLILWPLSVTQSYAVDACYLRHMSHRELMLNDYCDFLCRARWKLENRNSRAKLVGKYRSVVSENV